MKNFKEFLNEDKKFETEMFVIGLRDTADNLDDVDELDSEFLNKLADRIEQTKSDTISRNEIMKLAKDPQVQEIAKKLDNWKDTLDYVIAAS